MIEKIKKIIPGYALLPLIIVVVYNFSVYCGTRFFTTDMKHIDISIGLDEKIPLIPAMLFIYLGCYVFWVANYIIATRYDKQSAYQMVIADLLGKTICLGFFIFMPTIMTRPEITGTDLLSQLLKFVYSVDAADNLFPSIHCLVSWYCYLGVRKNKNVPKWYNVFSLIFALLICLSTVTVKQHVVLDVIAGVGFAQITYMIAGVIVKKRFKNS